MAVQCQQIAQQVVFNVDVEIAWFLDKLWCFSSRSGSEVGVMLVGVKLHSSVYSQCRRTSH